MKKPKVRPSHRNRNSNADILVSGSISIALAVRLLDKRIREGTNLFYTWYLHCEEVLGQKVVGCEKVGHGDDVSSRFGRLETMTYSAISERHSAQPAFEAIARAVNCYGWPMSVVQDVFNGFRRDLDEHSYKTVGELIAYCYDISGSVCVGMAEIFGVDVNDPWMIDRACDLGIAFQLTNIARRVMDDAKEGRVHLPSELFFSGSVSADFILYSANRSAVVAAKNVLLDLANEYYASADLAIEYLPWRIRCVTATAAGSYRVIASRIRWADDPWPVEQPAQFWAKMLNTISFFGLLAFNYLTPFRFHPDRMDLLTRSTYLKNGDWRPGEG